MASDNKFRSSADVGTTSTSMATKAKSKSNAEEQTFYLAKWAILRLLGSVYLVAFLGACIQNPGLIGSDGLAPAAEHMDRLRRSVLGDDVGGRVGGSLGFGDALAGFLRHPTLFWLWTSSSSGSAAAAAAVGPTDAQLQAVATTGLVLSGAVAFLGLDSWLALLSLWLLDFSIVTVAGGSSFYQYGWESQLLETGFLAIFLCDLPHLTRRAEGEGGGGGRWRVRGLWRDEGRICSPPSRAALYLMRWLCFRISLGAGLIKIRGGSCWEAKTCLHYHFETQPIPSPLSFAFHFLPKAVLSRAVDLDLFVQLYSSWLVLVPGRNWVMRNMRRLGGLIQSLFMVNIILSGNFAFLNHLTIVPALACLDDACRCWPRWLRRRVLVGERDDPRSEVAASGDPTAPTDAPGRRWTRWTRTLSVRTAIDAALVVTIGTLSLPVVTNLLQSDGTRQRMNASFTSLRLVNTYGAFGSVGEARYEPIISVSSDGVNDWREVEFPCKPGDVTRRPCFCAPYHYRLDWNIWFIGFKPHASMLRGREAWLYALLAKMLDGDGADDIGDRPRPWLALLDPSARGLFPPVAEDPPRFAKVDMYHYRMSAPLWRVAPRWLRSLPGGGAAKVEWWNRTFEESLVPPVTLDGTTGSLRLATLPPPSP